jgi:hypothetical protein
MADYNFDAGISIDFDGTQEQAADWIIDHCTSVDIAISLHSEGTLNVKTLARELAEANAEIERHRKALDDLLATCRCDTKAQELAARRAKALRADS